MLKDQKKEIKRSHHNDQFEDVFQLPLLPLQPQALVLQNLPHLRLQLFPHLQQLQCVS